MTAPSPPAAMSAAREREIVQFRDDLRSSHPQGHTAVDCLDALLAEIARLRQQLADSAEDYLGTIRATGEEVARLRGEVERLRAVARSVVNGAVRMRSFDTVPHEEIDDLRAALLPGETP